MTDRVLIGKNITSGETGLWVSKPGANVLPLAGNSYTHLKNIENWYGYQKEFDDSPETAWTAAGVTTTVTQVVYDPGVASTSAYTNWYIATSHGGGGKPWPQLKRSENNTLLISPTGVNSRMYTEYMFNTTSSTVGSYAPDERAFSGITHNVVEMRIRRNMDHPSPPTGAHQYDFNLSFVNSPVGGRPNSWTGLDDDPNGITAHIDDDATAPLVPVFWARKSAGVTLHQGGAHSPDTGNYSGYQFEYPSATHTDAYNIGGVLLLSENSLYESAAGIQQGWVFPNMNPTLLTTEGRPTVASGNQYDQLLPDGEWHIIEWDMSNDEMWMDPYKFMQDWNDVARIYNEDTSPTGIRRNNPTVDYWDAADGGGRRPLSSDYRICRMRIDLLHNSWNPTHSDPDNPPWLFEIDYVRVRKKGVREVVPDDDWYGFQEEFDWTSADDEVWANSSPGVNRSFIPTAWDSDNSPSPFGFSTGTVSANPADRGRIKRTTNNTLIYTGGYGDQKLFSPYFVYANEADVAGGGDGYPAITNPVGADISPGAIYAPDYPIIEMKIRRIYDDSNLPPINSSADFQIFHTHDSIIDDAMFDVDEAYSVFPKHWIDEETGSLTNWTISSGYAQAFGGPGDSSEVGKWKTVEWDMRINKSGGSSPTSWGNHPNYSGDYRLLGFRIDLTNSSGSGWDPETNPMWEIDYVRVKKETVPANLGRWNSRQAALAFDSERHHAGLIHQTGTVTIGTAKARIDGTTSDYVVGGVIDTLANGYVSFPSLDYIPLVLFQRIDENVDITGVSYPGGSDEISICTQAWEDHRYPTLDMDTSEPSWKSFDMPMRDGAYGGTSGDDLFSSSLTRSDYINEVTGEPYVVLENFWTESRTNIVGSLPEIWPENSPNPGYGGPYYPEYVHPVSSNTSSWGQLPSESMRHNNLSTGYAFGRHWNDMISYFHEVRTFAYVRAKKDGFWLTCRNAIAQEGMEPALNLAPVFPEDALAIQGFDAFTSMSSNNDNGAWGMFHPALALYDGNKFEEGRQLKWNTRTTANSYLLEKVGEDENGITYDQYKWWPSFSCSGLPFSGGRALPNQSANSIIGPIIPDAPLTYAGGFEDAQSYHIKNPAPNIHESTEQNAQYTEAGILRGDTGGFYPYRFQSNYHHMRHFALDGSYSLGANYKPSRMQFNIKRLSSEGIFHPKGTVPESSGAYNNQNIIYDDPGTIKNQTAYIGGAMNTKTDAGLSYADIATCQYPILGIDHTYIINLPIKTNPQTSGAAYDQMTAIMNSGASGHVKIGTELIGYHGMTWLNSMFYLDIEGLRAQGGTTSQDHYIGETVSIPTVTDYGVASYDAAKPKPAKYKYWVLRVPVSIPEHTV